ncbi:MAG: hypothetical protein IKA99_04930 [Clostridia bacterium]|nr:hypothetical protein [Clostridia bacterium]
MENVFAVLSQQFGLQTVIKAVVVCVIMMIVRKIKPNLSPKVEIVIRLALSVLIHVLFTIITNGEFLTVTKDVMCICGVSMIFSAIITKNYDKEELKDTIKPFLPEFDVDKIDEYKEQISQEKIVANETVENDRISIGS